MDEDDNMVRCLDIWELSSGFHRLEESPRWLSIGGKDLPIESCPSFTVLSDGSTVAIRASEIASESAAISSIGLSMEDALQGKHGGILQWCFTVEAQETGVRLGVCYEDEANPDFNNNPNLFLVGCGSGQRFVRGEWFTEGVIAANDAITTGKSATFTLDMRTACLWISVEARGKRWWRATSQTAPKMFACTLRPFCARVIAS